MPTVTTTSQTNNQNADLPYVQNNNLLPVVKKKPLQPEEQQNIPLMSPNGGNVTGQQLQQGSNQVMATAQNMAIKKVQQPDQTMGLVQKNVQGLLQNPMGQDYNPTQYINNKLEQNDRNRAQAMKAFQEQNADIANTGINKEAAYNMAMQSAQSRTDLQNKLQMEQNDKQRQAMLDALNIGQDVSKTQSGLDTESFNRLINARSAYEGEANRQAAKESQSSQQAWQSGENTLDRASKLAIQSGDQEFQKAMEAIKQANTLGQMATQNDYTTALAKLDQQSKLALQQGDIQGQKDIEALKGQLQVESQKAAQTWQSSENALDRQLKQAMQTGDQEFQKTLEIIKTQDEFSLMSNKYQFDKMMAELDNQAKFALQKNDIQGQKDIETLRGQLQEKLQKGQQQFDLTKQNLSQMWQTGERMSTQQFQKAQQATQIAAEEAAQRRDIMAQTYWNNQKNMIDLKMQTNEMDHDTKMKYLDSQLAETKANNDVKREETILAFKHGQEIDTLIKQGNIDRANMYLKSNLDKALQNNDYANQKVLIQEKAKLDAEQRDKDRALEEKRIDLQKLQIDMNGQQMTFDMIEQGVKNGQLDPTSAYNAVAAAAKQQGITIEKADPNAASIAINKEYQTQMIQYGLTHPDVAVKDKDGNVIGITKEGQTAFNEYVNSTVFGDEGYMKYITDTTGKAYMELIGKSDSKAYKDLLDKSVSYDYSAEKKNNTAFNIKIPEEKTYFKLKDSTGKTRLLYSLGDYKTDGYGQRFTVIDVATGLKYYVRPGVGIQGSPI